MKRKIAILLTVIMLVSALSTFLVACGETGGGSSSDGTLKLMVYAPTSNDAKEIYKDMIAEFTEETGVKVKITFVTKDDYNTKLKTNFKTEKNKPDVFFLDQPVLADWVEQCLDLTTGFFAEEEEEGLKLSDFYDCAVDTVTYQNKIMAVPFSLTTSVLLYNKSLVKNVPADWNEWINTEVPTGKALFGGIGSGGYASWYFQAFLKSAGGEMVNGTTVTFDDANGVKAAQMLVNLYAKSPKTIRDSSNAFTNGNIMYVLAHNSDIYNDFSTNPTWCEENLGATLFIPAEKDGKCYSNIGGENIAIYKGSSKLDSAKALVKFLLREENVNKAIYNNFSAVKSYAKVRTNDPITGEAYSAKLQEIMAVVLKQLDTVSARPVVKGWIEVNDIYLAQGLASIIDENANIQESLTYAKNQAQTVINKAQK